jgi:hypothetical protein
MPAISINTYAIYITIRPLIRAPRWMTSMSGTISCAMGDSFSGRHFAEICCELPHNVWLRFKSSERRVAPSVIITTDDYQPAPRTAARGQVKSYAISAFQLNSFELKLTRLASTQASPTRDRQAPRAMEVSLRHSSPTIGALERLYSKARRIGAAGLHKLLRYFSHLTATFQQFAVLSGRMCRTAISDNQIIAYSPRRELVGTSISVMRSYSRTYDKCGYNQ